MVVSYKEKEYLRGKQVLERNFLFYFFQTRNSIVSAFHGNLQGRKQSLNPFSKKKKMSFLHPNSCI